LTSQLRVCINEDTVLREDNSVLSYGPKNPDGSYTNPETEDCVNRIVGDFERKAREAYEKGDPKKP